MVSCGSDHDKCISFIPLDNVNTDLSFNKYLVVISVHKLTNCIFAEIVNRKKKKKIYVHILVC